MDVLKDDEDAYRRYSANCEHCFGLCCTALPYAKSADFAVSKDGGIPCSNLQADYRCRIHNNLRNSGYRGCTVYECYGAGQKVSQNTYSGESWRENPKLSKEMFAVFPIMQQLYEMLYYLYEALHLLEAKPIYNELQQALIEIEQLTNLTPHALLELNIHAHRMNVNPLLIKTSELVRGQCRFSAEWKKKQVMITKRDMIGAKLRGSSLMGADLRGVLLIAADLREADMRITDMIGADLRDADLRKADLRGSIFLTQAQLNSANGDKHTQLPSHLKMPSHWIEQ